MKNLLISLFALALSFAAAAAGNSSGTITTMIPLPGGIVGFQASIAGTGQPGCATQTGRYMVDTNTQAGRTFATTLQAAFALNKSITLLGTGTCTLWADSETLSYAVINY